MDSAEIVKNLKIAFNRTTSRGTILDALLKILEQGTTYEEIRSAILEEPPPPKQAGLTRTGVDNGPAPAVTGAFKDPVVQLKKHAGKRMSEIAQEDPGYLLWCIDQAVSSDWFRAQCRLALELYDTDAPPRKSARVIPDDNPPSSLDETDEGDVPF